jgi:predicted DNA-binding transcriptional regulator AlpA
MNQVINEVEASEKLHLATQTLRNWRHQRKGPPYLKIGRSVRYSLEDLAEYIESKKIVPEGNIIVSGVR